MERKKRVKRAGACVTTVVLVLAAVLAIWPPHTNIRTAAAAPKMHSALPAKHAQPRRDLAGESAWFRLSHFGLDQPPRDGRAKALRQARKLPRIHLPKVRQRGATAAGAAPAATTASSGAASTIQSWSPLGPAPVNDPQNCCDGAYSGRVTALAVDPSNSDDIWLGSANGGLWHTTDRGSHWTALTDGQDSLSVGSLALDPANAQTIYVGTGEANFNVDGYPGVGVLKSTDGGSSWTEYGFAQFAGMSIGRIVVDHGNSNILLLAASINARSDAGDGTLPEGSGPNLSSAGIWRSTDGGITWTQVLPGGAGTDVVFDPADPTHQTVYAALVGVSAKSNSTSAPSGIYKSTNGGQSFDTSVTSSELPASLNVTRITLAISQDGRYFYAVEADINSALANGNIYQSDHTAAVWRPISVRTEMAQDSDVLQPIWAGGEPERQWTYESAVAIDPVNSQVAYIGGVDLWQTVDGGNTWNPVQASSGVHRDFHALAFWNDQSEQFYVGSDGGIWLGSTGSSMFTDLNRGGLNLTQFYAGSVGTTGDFSQLYGGTQDNGTAQYPLGQSGAVQWDQVQGGDGGDVVVDYTNNAVVYHEFFYGDLHKSTDGGVSWSRATSGLGACTTDLAKACVQNGDNVVYNMPFVMSPSNHNELFAGTDRVFKTTDGAQSWSNPSGQPLDSGIPITALAVAASDDTVIYAGDRSGNVFVSMDGGTTFTATPFKDNTGKHLLTTGGIVTGIAVDPTSAYTVYVTLARFANCSPGVDTCGQHIFRSLDGGTTWTDIDGKGTDTLPNIPFESVAVDPANPQVVFAGTDAGVYQSPDQGTTWNYIYGLPLTAINQIFTDQAGANLYVATHGRGMWVASLQGGGSIYIGEEGYNMYALRGSDGAARWTTLISTWGNGTDSSPAVVNGIIYVGSQDTNVYALDATTGAQIWQFPTGDRVESSPAVVNGIVYVGSTDGSVYAINASTGAQVWQYQTGGPVYSSPSVATVTLPPPGYQSVQVVLIGSYDSYIYALDAGTGVPLWRYKTGGGIMSSPTVDNGIVSVGSMDGGVYTLQAATGTLAWKYQTGDGICTLQAPVVANGVIYLGSADHSVYALNETTGALVWRYQTGAAVCSAPAVVDSGKVYVGSEDHNVYALDAQTGATVWAYDTGNQVDGAATVASGVVYIGTSIGRVNNPYVYALDALTGIPLWRFETISSVLARPAVTS